MIAKEIGPSFAPNANKKNDTIAVAAGMLFLFPFQLFLLFPNSFFPPFPPPNYRGVGGLWSKKEERCFAQHVSLFILILISKTTHRNESKRELLILSKKRKRKRSVDERIVHFFSEYRKKNESKSNRKYF